MRVSVCVSSVGRSAALGDRKDFDFNVVLSQEGRAKNPALLIFYGQENGERGAGNWGFQHGRLALALPSPPGEGS